MPFLQSEKSSNDDAGGFLDALDGSVEYLGYALERGFGRLYGPERGLP
jgi:hypothetical protein